ncbi:DUF7507 domain-containing protein [Arsenicicoccus dermatophilus]|uniref:DUF7507 domain-containing protein n=1 Tax=Arsenicicoccus dermatophilus TaxID=1076331 RepID=UPI003B981BB1
MPARWSTTRPPTAPTPRAPWWPAPSSATATWTRTSTITMDKVSGGVVDANNNGRTDVGDTIQYTFTVKNTGTTTLTSVTYTDTKLGISGVAPAHRAICGAGPVPTVCPTRTYALTQADIDAGKVDDAATATVSTRPASRPPGPTRSRPTSRAPRASRWSRSCPRSPTTVTASWGPGTPCPTPSRSPTPAT